MSQCSRRLVLAVLCAVWMAPVSTFAQEVAVMRLYVVPKVADVSGPPGARAPKYIRALGVDFTAMDSGSDNLYLVAADLTSAQHATVAANADVIAVPLGLDENVNLAALDNLKARLETIRVSAEWVTTDHTYRKIVRAVGKWFQFIRRYALLHGKTFWQGGMTLDTRLNQLTATQRQELQAVADSFGLDTSELVNTMTIRRAVRLLADQLPAFAFGPEPF